MKLAAEIPTELLDALTWAADHSPTKSAEEWAANILTYALKDCQSQMEREAIDALGRAALKERIDAGATFSDVAAELTAKDG